METNTPFTQPVLDRHGNTNYRQLQAALRHFSEEQLDATVSVIHNGEVYPAKLAILNSDHELGDVLEDNHPVFEIV